MPFFSANGDEIAPVVKLTKESVLLVRRSQPVLLEFNTFRRYEHCGPNLDDQLGYRPESEISTYLERDPLRKFAETLIAKPEWIQLSGQIQIIIRKYVSQVFEKALRAPVGGAKMSELDALLQ